MNEVLVKPSIEQLRQLIGGITDFSKERSSFSLYPDGFARGTVVEIAGPGKTLFLSTFLKEHADLKAAWVEKKISINPYALFQKGVELKNILFIETGRESGGEELWCLTQIMQSGCFQVLVGSELIFQEKELRRLQLMTEKGNLYFFLLSEKLHQSWVPHLQLEVQQKGGEVWVQLQRKRGLG